MIRRAVPLGLVLVLAACASSSNGDSPRRSSSVITLDEIAGLSVQNAYQAVQQLRPQWLTPRSRTSSTPGGAVAVVYVDGMRRGVIEELRQVRAAQVQRMEFLRPSDATNRYGTNHTGGAIVVTTRAGGGG